jgi:hypothetical protein
VPIPISARPADIRGRQRLRRLLRGSACGRRDAGEHRIGSHRSNLSAAASAEITNLTMPIGNVGIYAANVYDTFDGRKRV